MPAATTTYLEAIRRLLTQLEEHETSAIDQAGQRVAQSITAGGVLHVFGSGHSMLAAIEPTVRAGGLAAVNLLFDAALSPTDPSRVSTVERLPGYAGTILQHTSVEPGEVLIVISHSGINPVPIEMAAGARERGLTVVAVTSLEHSRRASSRHVSGRRLYEVADIVVDTHAPFGDTTVDLASAGTGAVSTILACAAVNAITVRAAELLAGNGADVPVLVSQNVDGGDDHNERQIERYRR
ncbi:sugar isomerase domain-containing protein [Phytoactinopolyspora mesophila]|uniref:Sugar isomerase domain-containing protein n=1 Tax=Phytoactinopolyspora mesophila TaxID=2650750 RepID=A0A7K3M0Y8_9ACTN|nr:SIS domain-containing protein [Phytoactinopolyspora mesophila]NDL56108.1 sugar isomerase domain-containing protein [Phytoactinopolyspora mesophila]